MTMFFQHDTSATVNRYVPLQITRLGDEDLACTGQALRFLGAEVVALVDGPIEQGSAVTICFPEDKFVGEVTGCAILRDAFAISLTLIGRGASWNVN